MKDWYQFQDVGQGLALEADLYKDPGQHIVLWQSSSPALVCPRAYRKKDGFDLAVRRSEGRGWPVHQRPSGGGTVPLGPGVLNLAIALSAPQSLGIAKGYEVLCDPIISYGRRLGIELKPGATPHSFCDGDWNLSCEGRKIVGTAQRRRPLKNQQVRMLAHALILVDGPIGPAAEAVAAFHRDLGLEEVRSDAHTTLQDASALELPQIEDIAKAFRDEAVLSIEKSLQISV